MKLKLIVVIFVLLTLSACNGKSNDGNQPANSPTPGTTAEPNTAATVPPVPGPSPSATPSTGSTDPAGPQKSLPIEFVNYTRDAGIKFKHTSGATGKKFLPETMGPGCAFIDYDNDGWQDILFINSMSWPGQKAGRSIPALYHNNKNGSFTDVTKTAKLDLEMYGLGCAIADYDNDGFEDIFIACLGVDHLYRNKGNGTFEDVGARAGVANPDFSTSAVWFDYDKDGRLDLFVCNYVDWSIEKDIYCTLDGQSKSYCKPDSYKGQTSRLYHNKGNGSFEDVTEKSGLLDPSSKSLGVALIDYDKDGSIDLFVSNDTEPNKLYHNNGNGTFSEQGVTAGVAFSEAGVARAGMGVDVADYDDSGYPSLMVGNFANEMLGLYHNEGKGLFIDEAPTSKIGQATLLSLTFGCFFFDYDLDGREDIFLANGHVSDEINRIQPKITYAQPPKLFRNVGNKRFDDVSQRVGGTFQQPMVARGAAYGDFDNDGDLDLLVATNNGYARLFKNEHGNQNHVVRIKTEGVKSNRDGIGASITLKLANGSKQWRMVKSGSSYCSQSELPITFGIGKQDKVASIEVKWPSGVVDKLNDVAIDQLLVIKEGKGVTSTTPLAKQPAAPATTGKPAEPAAK